MRNYSILLVYFISLLFPQKPSQILGFWLFESMTTITKGKREEITILYKDDKNIESLEFKKNGLIIFDVLNDGINKTGKGVWYADETNVAIIVDSDTTYGRYEITGKSLTIVTNEEETKEYYGYSTILKYQKD
tara:strand:- start:10675 stop:11073 length:399 start_codon:yes stop_codon:yes gene_type:complete